MLIKEIMPEQAIYIVIDNDDRSYYLPKDELDKWIKDASIQVGFTVMQVTVHNVFIAKNKVELINKDL